MTYARVLLPLSLNWIPTFRSSENLDKGQFVRVEFHNKEYLGVVWESDVKPDINSEKIKDILSIERSIDNISDEEISLWNFVASYYLCPVSEVFRLAYPSFHSKAQSQKILKIQALKERINKLETQLSIRQNTNTKRLKSSVTQKLENQINELRIQLENEQNKNHFVRKTNSSIYSKPVLLVDKFENRIKIYVERIEKELNEGKQVLFLCPDLSFSSRLEEKLKCFNPCLANFKTSSSKRFEISDKARRGESILVLGTKNSIFLPFSNLSLIIIDEEQDSGFKNNESSPRFNARDCAVYLSRLHNCRIIIGSSCPSLESYNNALESKYDYLKLPDNQLSDGLSVIDLREEKRKNGVVNDFSVILLREINLCKNTIVLIKTWEKPEEIANFINQRFADKDIMILSLSQLKRSTWLKPELIAVLNADGLLSKDDFRADEKALQIASLLSDFAPKVIIQTTVPTRFNASRSLDILLEERRKFNFPPFSRMVNLCERTSSRVITYRFFARSSALNSQKEAFVKEYQSPKYYFDVDPLV